MEVIAWNKAAHFYGSRCIYTDLILQSRQSRRKV